MLADMNGGAQENAIHFLMPCAVVLLINKGCMFLLLILKKRARVDLYMQNSRASNQKLIFIVIFSYMFIIRVNY